MTEYNEGSKHREQTLSHGPEEPPMQQQNAKRDSLPSPETESGVPELILNANHLLQDQSMDRSSAHSDSSLETAQKDAPEMEIDLGYAEYTDAFSEDEELENFTSIDDLKHSIDHLDSVKDLENFAEALDTTDNLDDFEDSNTPTLTERVEDDDELNLNPEPENDPPAASRAWQSTSNGEIQAEDIARLEAIVFGEDEATASTSPQITPGQVSEPHLPGSQAAPPAESDSTFEAPDLQIRLQEATASAATPGQGTIMKGPSNPQAPLTAKGENPFLPKHIMERLNQGRNLVEEIAQSSAALDASTAILRTHARAERMHKPRYGESRPQEYSGGTATRSDRQRQALVDDLVEEYLPLIAAELRRRLNRMLDD